MKILLALLLSASGLFAQADYSTLLLLSKSQTSGTNFTVDTIWNDFEFDAAAGAATAQQITNASHTYITAVATSDASSLLSTSTSGQQTLLNKPNGLPDSGTRGLAINCNSTATGIWQYQIPNSNTVVFMCMVKTVSMSSGHDEYLIGLYDSGINYCSLLRYRNNGGTHQFLLQQGGDFDTVNVTAGNAYWVAMKYVEDGTCSAAVFDATTGTQVGSTQTTTDTNSRTPQYFRLGRLNASGAEAITIYVDNFCVGLTNVSFPVGP